MVDLAVVGFQFKTEEFERGVKTVLKGFSDITAAREAEATVAKRTAETTKQSAAAVESEGAVRRRLTLEHTILLRAESAAYAEQERVQRAAQAVQKQEAAAREAVVAAQRAQVAMQRNVSAALEEGRRRADQYTVTEANRAANEAKFDALRDHRIASERALGAAIAQRAAADRAAAEAWTRSASGVGQATTAVTASTVATTRAVPGLKNLQTNLGSLAIAAGGLPGPLGRTAQALSTFALGGGPAVLIIAGLSAIAYAYHEITGPAREAREAADKLVDSLNRARAARLGTDLIEDVETLTARLKDANRELERAEQGKVGFLDYAKAQLTRDRTKRLDLSGPAREEQAAVQRALDEAAIKRNTRLAEGLNEEQAIIDAANERKKRAAEKAAEEARRLRERELRETKEARERFEDIVSGTLSKGNPGILPSTLQTTSRKTLFREGLLEPAAIASSGKEVETRLSAAYDEAARNFQRGLTSAIEGVITGAPDLGRQLGQAIVGGMAGVLTAALTDAVSKSMASKLFMDGVKNGVGGLSALFQSQKIGNLGSAIAGGAIGYSSGNAATGALGGAASGFALGGPAGAIVGGIAGIVGGLLGSSKQAKEAAREMEEARKAFGLALDAFTAEAFGTATNLSRNIANANRLGDELKGNAPKPVLASGDADDVRRFRKELEDYVATLGRVDEATAAYITRLQEEEETRLQMINLSLEEREARLAGNDRGALEARAAREQAEVQRQLRNGEITAAIAARTSAVIDGELAQSIADLGKEAEEAAKQIEEANAAFATSLVGRELQARARLATSDAEREGIEDMIRAEQYRLEIEAAVKDGISETNIAALKRIHGLEEEAIAMERSKKAEEDRLRIIKESTAFLDDLKVREFRATGQGAAADEYAQRERDRQELIKAAEFGADYVMETLRVQGLERADRDAQRRAQQEAAFGNSFGTTSTSLLPDSRTSVNLAVGTSESTTNRLVGVIQSQLIHIQATASNTAEAAVLLRRIAASLDGGVTAIVDEGLAIAGSDADLGAGVVPGNR